MIQKLKVHSNNYDIVNKPDDRKIAAVHYFLDLKFIEDDGQSFFIVPVVNRVVILCYVMGTLITREYSVTKFTFNSNTLPANKHAVDFANNYELEFDIETGICELTERK